MQCNTTQKTTIIHVTMQFKIVHSVQYITVQYSTVQYSTVQYSTVQYSTVHTIQSKTSQYHTLNHHAIQIPLHQKREGLPFESRCVEGFDGCGASHCSIEIHSQNTFRGNHPHLVEVMVRKRRKRMRMSVNMRGVMLVSRDHPHLIGIISM